MYAVSTIACGSGREKAKILRFGKNTGVVEARICTAE
jgi:hypothetical protein